MSTESDSDTSTNGPSSGGECMGCDVGGLACTTEMYAKQAEVAQKSTEALKGYQDKFAEARGAYTKVRSDAKADVHATKDLLGGIKDTLKCVLDKDERACLKSSLEVVKAAIQECTGTTGGCCVGECSYPSEATEGETTSSLAGLIDEYTQEAARNQACFEKLIELLASIPTGVAELKAAVEQLDADVKADGDKDLVRLYARYLVLQWRLEGDALFGGFSSVNAYVDCLCKAMQCSYAAWQAIIELEGRKARLECEERARKEECDRKQRDILEDILCEYEKCRPEPPAEDPHDEDCGCSHRHPPEGTSPAPAAS